MNPCPNGKLHFIDRGILAVSFRIAGIIVRRVNQQVMLQIMNPRNKNSIVLDCNTIMWQLFCWYVYTPFFVVRMEVSDMSADATVCLRAVKTLFKNIHFPLANEMSQQSWEVSRLICSSSYNCNLAVLREKPHLDLLFQTWGPTTLEGFLSSFSTGFESVYSLSDCNPHCHLPNHTASAFSSAWWLFCTLRKPSYTHCQMYSCNFILSVYLTWTVHSA